MILFLTSTIDQSCLISRKTFLVSRVLYLKEYTTTTTSSQNHRGALLFELRILNSLFEIKSYLDSIEFYTINNLQFQGFENSDLYLFHLFCRKYKKTSPMVLRFLLLLLFMFIQTSTQTRYLLIKLNDSQFTNNQGI